MYRNTKTMWESHSASFQDNSKHCIAVNNIEINKNNDIIIIDITLLPMQMALLLPVINGLLWNLSIYHHILFFMVIESYSLQKITEPTEPPCVITHLYFQRDYRGPKTYHWSSACVI